MSYIRHSPGANISLEPRMLNVTTALKMASLIRSLSDDLSGEKHLSNFRHTAGQQ